MRRYFLHLAYNGSHHCGWQIQNNGRTIQGDLEKAFLTLMNYQIDVTGCGRTDTGVHASNYYAHFELNEEIVDERELIHRLNGILDGGISIYDILPVEAEAHARFDATMRTYRYYIYTDKHPFYKDFCWRMSFNLNHDKIAEAAELLIGSREFECFAKAHSQVKDFVCEITSANWMRSENKIVFEISANRFLRGMVRAIVGTLVEIGRGKMNIEEFNKLLESGDRSKAGAAAPAQGLFLVDVKYPYIVNESDKGFPFSI